MTDVCRERTNYSRCGKPTLPRMTVCAYHATPDATWIVMEEMAAEIEKMKDDAQHHAWEMDERNDD